MNRLNYFLTLIFACCVTFSFAQNATKVEQEVEARKGQGINFSKASLFTTDTDLAKKNPLSKLVTKAVYLQLDEQKLAATSRTRPEALSLQLPGANGKTHTLNLVKYDVTSPDFSVVTNLSNGQPVAYTPGLHYRGSVAGSARSLVAISIFNDEISGIISTPTTGKMVLSKLGSSTKRNGIATDYAFYNEADMTVQNEFECGAQEIDNYGQRMIKYLEKVEVDQKMLDANNCVRVYFETDFALYQEKNSSVTDVTNWVTGMYNVVAAIYQNEQVNTVISQLYVWQTLDSYPAGSSDALNAFRAARPNYNGDLAHLICRKQGTSGGIAWVDALCSSYGYAFSGIGSSYAELPSYSWTVDVVAHEMGHNVASPHTHSCSWPNGPIDNCYTQEGSCNPGPDPGGPGTVMSYCHLTSNGKDLTLGFGPLPGDLIRSRVYNANCLAACNTGTPTCEDGLQNGNETGIDCGGPDCAACPTCDDGVQNGDETGVDCGGPNCAPCPCFGNEVEFTVTIDQYGNETSWSINDANGSSVASGAGYAGNSTTTENVCLPDGCYDLVVNDSYGDGICCAYGQGSYTLTDADGTVLASGGEFGSSETTNFCVSTTAAPTCDDGVMNGNETGVDCGGDCAPCEVLGCTDANAHNYDSAANTDDGSCETCNDGVMNGDETAVDCGGTLCAPCPVPGCTDANAHNYNPNADTDDGSCETCADGVLNGDETAVDCGGALCASCPVPGCTDETAHNYNPNADTDDGSCETCADGVLNGDETAVDCGGALCASCPVPGCTDETAHNYNPNADTDDGSCETCSDGVLNGDETAIDCGGALCEPCTSCNDGIMNGNETAIDCGGPDCHACPTCDDGIKNGNETAVDCGGPDCAPCVILGCTDATAHNYDANANTDDGSCETCNDGILNGDETAVDCGGSLCAPCAILGCTDATAHNYNPEADTDDGSCETCNDGVMNGDETAVDCGGSKCAPCAILGCTDASAHNYNPNADTDDGSCETCADGVLNGDETDVDCGGALCVPCVTCTDGIENGNETGVDCGGPDCAPCAVLGCTDANAHNYDPNADTDDGSCETCADGVLNGDETDVDCGGALCAPCAVLGCTDATAHNYDPNADTDDGSCETCSDGVMNGDETDVDCGGALCAPCNTGGCTYERINFNNFDNGWGIWNDGGSDCRRSANDAAYANSGDRCVRLRDNTSTSVMTTDVLDLSMYEELTVDFSFLGRSMENNEDFWLQISLDGGATYTTLEAWRSNTEFVNGTRVAENVVIPGPFTTTTTLRFRADASGNSDYVYIDDVVIDGCLDPNAKTAAQTPVTSATLAPAPTVASPLVEQVEVTDFNLFPNPASDYINVAFNLTAETETQLSIISITGKVIEVRDLGLISGMQTERFNSANFAPGYYFATVRTKAGIQSNKFVIVR